MEGKIVRRSGKSKVIELDYGYGDGEMMCSLPRTARHHLSRISRHPFYIFLSIYLYTLFVHFSLYQLYTLFVHLAPLILH